MVLQNGTRSLRKPSFSVGLRHFGKEDFSLESPLKPRLFGVWRRVAISGKSGYCLYSPSCLLNNLSFLFDIREKEIPRTRSEGKVVAVFMTQRLFFSDNFSDIIYDILRRCRSIIFSNPQQITFSALKTGEKSHFRKKDLAKESHSPNNAFPLDIKQKYLYAQRKLSKNRVFPLIIELKMRFSVLSRRAFEWDPRERL